MNQLDKDSARRSLRREGIRLASKEAIKPIPAGGSGSAETLELSQGNSRACACQGPAHACPPINKEGLGSRVKRRFLALPLTIFALTAQSGCDDATKIRLEEAGRSLGLSDEPPPPPEAVDIICNPNAGNVCTRDTATTVINAAVEFIAARPGSSLRFWVLANQATDTRPLGTITSPAPPEGSERVARARRAQFITNTRAYFSLLFDSVFRAERMRRTPLAEGLTQVALATTGSLPRRVVVLSDVYEESTVGGWECLLPTSATFQARLQRRRLLPPGSLSHTGIYFTFAAAGAQGYRRCASALSRELGARDLWRMALGRAGAEVRFDTELRAFNPEPAQHDR